MKITISDVNKLPAGRELDILVAEHVFGKTEKLESCPVYSVSYGHAASIADKYRLFLDPDFPNEGDWECHCPVYDDWRDGWSNETYSVARSIPHVVCLTALKVVILRGQKMKITISDVNKLPAGRELDILVAEHVFGKTEKLESCPVYSVSYGHAASIADKYRLSLDPDFPNEGDWECHCPVYDDWRDGWSNETYSVARSIPHVVCLTALKVVILRGQNENERNKP